MRDTMKGSLCLKAMHKGAVFFSILMLQICYSLASSVIPMQVENVTFPATGEAPGSNNSLFLGGAGVRGLEIAGNFVKFTAIGIYLQDNAVSTLAVKWKDKTPQEVTDSVEFFKDIITGPFDKFMQVTMILPLTGQQYSEKVIENCVAIWKQMGIYTDAEAKAVEGLKSVFRNETFPPGSSILFTVLTNGSLVISFSKDGSIPKVGSAVIDNKQLSETVLESMIGKDGVSPAAKQSLATRLSELFKESGGADSKDEKSASEGHVEKLFYMIYCSAMLLFVILMS